MASWAPAYDAGIANMTEQDYCAKQEMLYGLDAGLCAQRFQLLKTRAQGKGQKAYNRWAHGKGTAY